MKNNTQQHVFRHKNKMNAENETISKSVGGIPGHRRNPFL